MEKLQVLAAVMPDTRAVVDAALGRICDVIYAANPSDAVTQFGTLTGFALIICCVHFGPDQVLSLVQRIASNPTKPPVPILCLRAYHGVLPEEAFRAVNDACAAFNARYLDMTHWVDAEGYDAALRRVRDVVASMVRYSSAQHSPSNWAASPAAGHDPFKRYD
jgi:CheY-like chemotaxis protein